MCDTNPAALLQIQNIIVPGPVQQVQREATQPSASVGAVVVLLWEVDAAQSRRRIELPVEKNKQVSKHQTQTV